MIRYSLSLGILTATLALAIPFIASAATIEFDRNDNGRPDISWTVEIAGHGLIAFDNDEDDTYDFGLVLGVVVGAQPSDIVGVWIDKNGDGEVKKNEVRRLHETLPYATFPSSFTSTIVPNTDGSSADYFFEYHPGSAVAGLEIGRDLNCDGDLEVDIFPAYGDHIGNFNFTDRNNDGFFDVFVEIVDGFTVERFDLKKLSRHLPVLAFASDSCLDAGF
ncbi:MAG TPA: hypothetical protein VJB82_01640 [Candidatus Peribacterales bacterium]|nr:hypothetical protein [Candidatus Peribacterales bacterium]